MSPPPSPPCISPPLPLLPPPASKSPCGISPLGILPLCSLPLSESLALSELLGISGGWPLGISPPCFPSLPESFESSAPSGFSGGSPSCFSPENSGTPLFASPEVADPLPLLVPPELPESDAEPAAFSLLESLELPVSSESPPKNSDISPSQSFILPGPPIPILSGL